MTSLKKVAPATEPVPLREAPAPVYHIRAVPALLVESMWHYAEPYLKRALDHGSGEFTLDDFLQLCLRRDVQLWLVSHEDRVVGAITTEVVNYPQRRHCRVITLAGSGFEHWVGTADRVLSEWAIAQGCNALESYVRRGLVPKMAPFNYKHKHSVLIKELTP